MESLCEPKAIEENERKEEDKAKDKVGCFDMVGGFFNEFGHKIGEAFTFGIPTVELAGFQIPSIDFHKVEFLVELLLKNPNPIPIPLVDINYVVESDGKKLVSGSINDSGEIPSHGSDTIKVPVTLVYEDITKMSCEITPGSVIPYKIVVDLIIHIPIIGKVPIPFEMTGEIPIPKMPNVVLNDIRFDKFTFEETIAVLGLKLENTNEFVLGLMSLDFEVWLAGLNIGGAKLTENLSEVGEKGVSYIDVPFSFKPEDFGTALWDLISGEGTQGRSQDFKTGRADPLLKVTKKNLQKMTTETYLLLQMHLLFPKLKSKGVINLFHLNVQVLQKNRIKKVIPSESKNLIFSFVIYPPLRKYDTCSIWYLSK